MASFVNASALVADGIFQDGFEECGAGHWSSGDPAPIAEKITGLTPLELASALGACAPSLTGAQFVLADGSAPDETTLGDMANVQSAIFESFGTGGIVPTAGGAMIGLSSGTARDAAHEGYQNPNSGTPFGDGHSTLGPSVFMSAHSGVFPSNCSEPGDDPVYDTVGLRLTFSVPDDADRLALDWRFLAADYPEWVCTVHVDYFLAIVVTGTSPLLRTDRNVVFDGEELPISVNSGLIEVCTGCSSGDGELAGTGYVAGDAAGTLWHAASVPVVAGETLVLDLLAFDVSDRIYDSLVLLDGMRWLAD